MLMIQMIKRIVKLAFIWYFLLCLICLICLTGSAKAQEFYQGLYHMEYSRPMPVKATLTHSAVSPGQAALAWWAVAPVPPNLDSQFCLSAGLSAGRPSGSTTVES